LKQLRELSVFQHKKIPELAETLRMLHSGAEAARILVPDTRKLATVVNTPQENNKRKAPGSDEIPPQVFAMKQQCHLQGQQAIAALFSQSIQK
jgi:hypothetical protein